LLHKSYDDRNSGSKKSENKKDKSAYKEEAYNKQNIIDKRRTVYVAKGLKVGLEISKKTKKENSYFKNDKIALLFLSYRHINAGKVHHGKSK
jgi:hypothetical protein